MQTLYFIGLLIFSGITLAVVTDFNHRKTANITAKQEVALDSVKTILNPILDTSKYTVTISPDSVISSAKADSMAYSVLSNEVVAYDSLIEEALYFAGQYYELATRYLTSGAKSNYERFIYVSDSFIGDANRLEDEQRILVDKIANFKKGLYGVTPHLFHWVAFDSINGYKYNNTIVLGTGFTIIKH